MRRKRRSKIEEILRRKKADVTTTIEDQPVVPTDEQIQDVKEKENETPKKEDNKVYNPENPVINEGDTVNQTTSAPAGDYSGNGRNPKTPSELMKSIARRRKLRELKARIEAKKRLEARRRSIRKEKAGERKKSIFDFLKKKKAVDRKKEVERRKRLAELRKKLDERKKVGNKKDDKIKEIKRRAVLSRLRKKIAEKKRAELKKKAIIERIKKKVAEKRAKGKDVKKDDLKKKLALLRLKKKLAERKKENKKDKVERLKRLSELKKKAELRKRLAELKRKARLKKRAGITLEDLKKNDNYPLIEKKKEKDVSDVNPVNETTLAKKIDLYLKRLSRRFGNLDSRKKRLATALIKNRLRKKAQVNVDEIAKLLNLPAGSFNKKVRAQRTYVNNYPDKHPEVTDFMSAGDVQNVRGSTFNRFFASKKAGLRKRALLNSFLRKLAVVENDENNITKLLGDERFSTFKYDTDSVYKIMTALWNKGMDLSLVAQLLLDANYSNNAVYKALAKIDRENGGTGVSAITRDNFKNKGASLKDKLAEKLEKDVTETKIKKLESENEKLKKTVDKLIKDKATLDERKELASKMASLTGKDYDYWMDKFEGMSITEFRGVQKLATDLEIKNRSIEKEASDDIIEIEEDKIEGSIPIEKSADFKSGIDALAEGFMQDLKDIKKKLNEK